MKVKNIYAFQQKAITEMHQAAVAAHASYKAAHIPQVISFTAPTGAGKTIMSAALMEEVFWGTDNYLEQPDAIFVWLSDSPELNKQSRDKIDTKADKIRLDQCVMIDESSFNQEILEDGKIYFLNTQKIGKKAKLTQLSDNRQFTIWDTLRNTAEQKADRLYVIIDEAHRGMHGNEAGKATSIMQKFIVGSKDDDLPPMPLVIGMSATSERFEKLVVKLSGRSIQSVEVSPSDVRNSGLLKDKIFITYPDNANLNEMALLEAAAVEWKEKWYHWDQYCKQNHHAAVNPIMLVQVENGNDNSISSTDLDLCLEKIEQRSGFKFEVGQVMHTFGQTSSKIVMNGLEVPSIEPSSIADDKNIRVVFFKEKLTTGWDCPRAETMMSFRHATDATYIAQLLGRMVRTPLGQGVKMDDFLNDVRLFLPHFDKNTVKDVVDALQNEEGGALPSEIVGEEYGTQSVVIMGASKPIKRRVIKSGISNIPSIPGLVFMFDSPIEEDGGNDREVEVSIIEQPKDTEEDIVSNDSLKGDTVPLDCSKKKVDVPKTIKIKFDYEDIDRLGVIRYINGLALGTSEVRQVQINDYYSSLFNLVRFLSQTKINTEAQQSLKKEIVGKIHEYADRLRITGDYDALKAKVLSFEMHSQVFDAMGNAYEQTEKDFFAQTDVNLEQQFRQAEAVLGKEGIAIDYCKTYSGTMDLSDCKIDVVLYANNENCMANLKQYAKEEFHSFNDMHRRNVVYLDEMNQKRYADIIKSADKVSETNFILPENIEMKKADASDTGDKYYDHLYIVTDKGYASLSLKTWEKDVLDIERKRSDFVTWYRNPSAAKATNALVLVHTHNGEKKGFHPDFLIVRKDATDGFVVDILEPHNPAFDDNVSKAKALAEYAKKHFTVLGRVEMIRAGKMPHEYIRLDMCKSLIQDEVLKIQSAEELNHLFDKYGKASR